MFVKRLGGLAFAGVTSLAMIVTQSVQWRSFDARLTTAIEINSKDSDPAKSSVEARPQEVSTTPAKSNSLATEVAEVVGKAVTEPLAKLVEVSKATARRFDAVEAKQTRYEAAMMEMALNLKTMQDATKAMVENYALDRVQTARRVGEVEAQQTRFEAAMTELAFNLKSMQDAIKTNMEVSAAAKAQFEARFQEVHAEIDKLRQRVEAKGQIPKAEPQSWVPTPTVAPQARWVDVTCPTCGRFKGRYLVSQ